MVLRESSGRRKPCVVLRWELSRASGTKIETCEPFMFPRGNFVQAEAHKGKRVVHSSVLIVL